MLVSQDSAFVVIATFIGYFPVMFTELGFGYTFTTKEH